MDGWVSAVLHYQRLHNEAPLLVDQLRNTFGKYNWEIQFRNPVKKYNREIQLKNTVKKYNWEIQLKNTVKKYNSEIRLRNTLDRYNWEIPLINTIDKYDWEIQLKNTIEKYSWVGRGPCHTINVYIMRLHCLIPQSCLLSYHLPYLFNHGDFM